MEKINVAELLKDCPKGMELDCTMIDNVVFEKLDFISSHHPIIIRRTDSNKTIHLTKYGQYSDEEDYKCVIFPKGKTTWEGFHRPFKDGDILFYKHKSNNIKYIFIYKRRVDMHYLLQYCGWFSEKPYLSEQFNAKERIPLYENDDIRFATEEEKEKLFKAIKDNGYMWNAETKTLEKLVEPKFKVGDKIRHKVTNKDDVYEIDKVYDDSYGLVGFTWMIYMKYQDQYELIPNKFDITTLKPFDKVLVRLTKNGVWNATFFSHYDKEVNWGCYPFVTTSSKSYSMCIPYEQNKHLLGTTDDCDEFYKNW